MNFGKILIILSLLCFGEKGFSQNHFVSRDTLPHVFTQNKINAEFIGVSFQREKAISTKNTSVFYASLNYSFYLTSGKVTSKFGNSIDFTIETGRRHYYRIFPSSLDRKQNVGNFLGADIGFNSGSILYKQLYYHPIIFIEPYWGIQRKFAKNGSFEFGLGLVGKYFINRSDNIFRIAPSLQLQVGWLINKRKLVLGKGK